MKQDLAADYYERHHAGKTGTARYGMTVGGEERLAWFRERIGRGHDVLDIGCRDGTFTSTFVDGNNVYGVDFDPSALEVARTQLGIEVTRVNLNQERLPFDDESFDVVVAGEILEHLQFPDVVASEIYRVLRVGGRFLGSVPNAFRLRNRLDFLMGKDFEKDPTHLHQFSPEKLREVLSKFQVEELDFICGRRRWMHPRLMASKMAWVCHRVR